MSETRKTKTKIKATKKMRKVRGTSKSKRRPSKSTKTKLYSEAELDEVESKIKQREAAEAYVKNIEAEMETADEIRRIFGVQEATAAISSLPSDFRQQARQAFGVPPPKSSSSTLKTYDPILYEDRTLERLQKTQWMLEAIDRDINIAINPVDDLLETLRTLEECGVIDVTYTGDKPNSFSLFLIVRKSDDEIDLSIPQESWAPISHTANRLDAIQKYNEKAEVDGHPRLEKASERK